MRSFICLIAAMGCVVMVCAADAAEVDRPVYRVEVLPDQNTTSTANAFATSIDDLGIAAGGYTLTNGAVNATLWVYGRQIPLGTLGTEPELASLVQWPVKNVLGLISGISYMNQIDPNKEDWSCSAFLGGNPDFHVCRGFVLDPATQKMRALPTLGGTNGFATGTNNLGETAGWAENTVRDPTCISPQVLQFKPVVWGPRKGAIRELPLIGTDGSGAATALNDRGQIVGISGDCDYAVGAGSAKHAVLWDNGVPVELVNPSHAPYWNTPMMINERGAVVGFAGQPNDPQGLLTKPFLWTRRDGWIWLPLLAGDVTGTASSINNHGVVIGYSADANGNNHPWVLIHDKLWNLNDLIDPGSGINGPIVLAFDINDRGEISGTTMGGQAVIARPVWH
jgi:hypothetical protein